MGAAETGARALEAEGAGDTGLGARRESSVGALHGLPDPDAAPERGFALEVGLETGSTREVEGWAFGGVGAFPEHGAPQGPYCERRLTDRGRRPGEVFRVRKPGVAATVLSQPGPREKEQGPSDENRQATPIIKKTGGFVR